MNSTTNDNSSDKDIGSQLITSPESLLSILIVDDDKTNRLILSTLIKKLNYHVISAVNGKDAIAVFKSEQPDIILMDVMMPVMDGYDAATEIKRICDGVFVPIIFLTSITDENALAKCIEHGGDDFITKPYNSVIIKAKIEAMTRVRNLYNQIADSKLELVQHHNRLHNEHKISKAIFTNITKPENLDIKNIKYLLRPMSVTSGDILLCSRTPSGGMHVMLGDFTGHGLSAAIGVIPVAETFYSLSSKGYSIGELAFNINKKIKEILPEDFFCAAGIIEIDAAFRTIAVWNGGIPDILITSNDKDCIRFSSTHLPLGILPDDKFERDVTFTEVSHNSKIYLISDGVIEAKNCNGQMLTQEKLESVIDKSKNSSSSFHNIEQAIDAFCENSEQNDDITLIEITAHPFDTIETHAKIDDASLARPVKWELSLKLEEAALQHTNPCPMITQSIMEIQGISEHRERIYTVLSELFSNSLEHGLLKLDSSIKNNPNGFLEYYNSREAALSDLADSYININIQHIPVEYGGRLIIIIEDSGTGFDISTQPPDLPDNLNSYGRGISIVKSLCSSLVYSNDGRKVEVHYDWRTSNQE